ncbi:MAG: hypothetical protein HKN87_19450 [Saprospiraceae bacterium]|nr:hypothetical protein [Saprospiraceae bacterium]
MVPETDKFLRVGGKIDYKISDKHMPPEFHEHGFLSLEPSVDLNQAIRAEVTLEMVQSHEDTKGLTVRINNYDPIAVPDLPSIPRPQSAYMLHTFPTVGIPLSYLKAGNTNRFRLDVDTAQAWNWPQNIFYAVVFRVYYEPDKWSQPNIEIGSIKDGHRIEDEVKLDITAGDTERITKVDYLGLYADFDWEGNGIYRQWHGHTHRGEWRNHIGSSSTAPFEFTWSTEWLPDQIRPVEVCARISLEDGLTYVTESIKNLHLDRSYSVELCRPYHQPENWVTRSDTFQAHFAVHGPLEAAKAYQVAWRSWSPCYGRGLFINGQKVWYQEDPCYGYAEHLIEVSDVSGLQLGENTIETGMTPLIDGKMVHGMEVQHPGVMVKVKYHKPIGQGVSIREGAYENRPHFIITTPSATYYYDKAGGGFSRMIDSDGTDWIDFRMQPWGMYPEAAASAFRGIPNFVYGSDNGGAGHPGHDKCVSKIEDDHAIITSSKSGVWQWRWTFANDHAEVEMLKTDPSHAYWFLYEGVPAGSFDPTQQYFGTNTGGPRKDQLDFFKGNKAFENWQWAYFGHEVVDRVLFIAQKSEDSHSDTFGYLGNSEHGITSLDGMVVFGFGRADGAKPLMTGRNTFYLAFLEHTVKNSQAHLLMVKRAQSMMNK